MAVIEPTPAPAPMLPQPYQVAGVSRDLPDTVTLELVSESGPRPPFACGQFNMLYAFGVGEIAVSLSGDPAERDKFIHTVRAVGAVSTALAGLSPGDTVGLRGPFGKGWPLEQAVGTDVLVIAGGLGLAPLRPLVYEILANRDRYGRIVLLVGSRHPSDLLYRDELEHWRQHLDIEIEVTVDHADAGWHGNVGVVPGLIERAPFDPARVVAMVCGPEIMMRFTVNALREAGVADERIHLSMERNMKCAVGLCGHCQFGPKFVCRDGPVLPLDAIADILAVREI
jgi:NAD(P)H-flavin reductase